MYVVLSKEQFEESLPKGWEYANPPNTMEYVYDVPTKNPEIKVRVYSTVDMRTGWTREKGTDAIRVVFVTKGGKPIGKDTKVLRVEGKTTIQERIQQRVNFFLNNLPEPPKKEEKPKGPDPEYLKKILKHPSLTRNKFAQSLLEGLEKHGGLTQNQLLYVIGDASPKGYPTMETQVRRKDPNYFIEERLAEEKGKLEKPAFEIPQNFYVQAESLETDEERREPTADYQYWKYPFENFNPVQSRVLDFKDIDANLVIGANTSAGKTICAEILMDVALWERNHKVIYMSPLKSLSAEKMNDWTKRFPDHKVIMLTGDTLHDMKARRRMMEEAAKSDIIIMTSELLDSVTRHSKREKYNWLNQVGLVVVDEAHSVTMQGRGHVIECALMRFCSINPTANILLLSATMSNTPEMAEWISHINSKETNMVFSTWRPVELQLNWVGYDPIMRGMYPNYQATEQLKCSIALDLVQKKPTEKFLIFVHSKNAGRMIQKMTESQGIPAHFHNADLDAESRKEIEQEFMKRQGGLRVLISTSTTAYGVNLPARNVIILGIHRGLNEVDELDIIQELGRAGRYGIDDEGFGYIICPNESLSEWQEKIKNPRPVTSVLNDVRILAFHVVSEINNGEIKNAHQFLAWYKRSLASLQGDIVSLGDAHELLKELERIEAITYDSKPAITPLGRVASWLYYDPYDIYDWACNGRRIREAEGDEWSDLALSYFLGNIGSIDMGYLPKEIADLAQTYEWDLKELGLRANNRALHCLAYFRNLKGIEDEDEPPSLKATRRSVTFDIERTMQAIKAIDKNYEHWEKDNLWEILPLRIKYQVPAELLGLVKVKGIGGRFAKKLYDVGIKNVADLVSDDNYALVRNVLKPATANRVIIEARKQIEREG